MDDCSYRFRSSYSTYCRSYHSDDVGVVCVPGLSQCLSVSVTVPSLVYQSVSQYLCLSLCLSISLSISLSLNLSVYQSVSQSLCLSAVSKSLCLPSVFCSLSTLPSCKLFFMLLLVLFLVIWCHACDRAVVLVPVLLLKIMQFF